MFGLSISGGVDVDDNKYPGNFIVEVKLLF